MRGCAAALLILLAAPAVPQCPLTPVASAQFRSTIFDLAAENGRLWAATGYGLTLYDITVDPPRALDSIALAGSTRVVRAASGLAYAASGSAIQVVRWNGRELQLAGTADAGATVNDLALTANALYAATANGIVQFDLLDPSAPAKTSVTFAISDRRLRAFDVSSAAAPVEIFRTELAPTSGTVNRINAVVVSNGHLYAGAGDIGLLTYDVRQFASPFPVRDYTAAATNSVATSVTQAWFARATGLVEYAISPFGALTEARSWDSGRASVVHDFDGGFLVTSSVKSAALWAVGESGTPSPPIGTATFPSSVRHAVVTGTIGYFLLDDKTLWTANFADASPTPKQIVINLAPQFIARGGTGIALAELRNDGTTSVGLLNASSTAIASTVSVP